MRAQSAPAALGALELEREGLFGLGVDPLVTELGGIEVVRVVRDEGVACEELGR